MVLVRCCLIRHFCLSGHVITLFPAPLDRPRAADFRIFALVVPTTCAMRRLPETCVMPVTCHPLLCSRLDPHLVGSGRRIAGLCGNSTISTSICPEPSRMDVEGHFTPLNGSPGHAPAYCPIMQIAAQAAMKIMQSGGVSTGNPIPGRMRQTRDACAESAHAQLIPAPAR